MARSQARKAAITGGPGGGKSSLVEELARCGLATRGEVARDILKAEGGMELRDQDPLGFAGAMLEAQLAVWEDANLAVSPVIFDRGFPDIVGFLRAEGLAVPAAVDHACRKYRLDGPVFHARPWREIYRSDEQRIQSWDEALASDREIERAWRDYGYELIALPQAGLGDRARFIIERL